MPRLSLLALAVLGAFSLPALADDELTVLDEVTVSASTSR